MAGLIVQAEEEEEAGREKAGLLVPAEEEEVGWEAEEEEEPQMELTA